MKKLFETPTVELQELDVLDVITTSNIGGLDPDEGEPDFS